jgi:hypothetical protein
MGSLFSKTPPPATPSFKLDTSTAKYDAAEVQRQLTEAQQKASTAVTSAVTSTKAALSSFYTPIIWLLGLAVLVVVCIVIYDFTAPDDWPNIFFSKRRSGTSTTQYLNIVYAYYGLADNDPGSYVDVTANLQKMVIDGRRLPGFTVNYTNVGLSTEPFSGTPKNLYVSYYVSSSSPVILKPYADSTMFPELPLVSSSGYTSAPPTIYQTLFGPSNGGLTGDHDATKPATIPGNSAPLSGPPLQKEGFEPNTSMVVRDTELKGGAYGMQWWMFVKDWNYAFGKEKIVLQRPDATNPSILNPKITLHPTDNSLVVSVSVFPNTQGGSSKAQPAPAGHSGSSDDVFVCTVPNIPLQTWFAVGVTCFGRNLDVYIDGKLVKSCFLSGVPKPCLGDIQLTPQGGFSGYICDFKHFSKMLVPEDVNAFWSTGTSCRNKTMTSKTQQATGHSVSFGIHDVTGKKITEWSF